MSDSPSKQVPDSADFTVSEARYSKGNYIVRCPSTNGLKSRAARLIGDGLNCRYTRREKGYVASPSKLAKFRKLYAAGWDASFVTGELQPDLSAAVLGPHDKVPYVAIDERRDGPKQIAEYKGDPEYQEHLRKHPYRHVNAKNLRRA